MTLEKIIMMVMNRFIKNCCTQSLTVLYFLPTLHKPHLQTRPRLFFQGMCNMSPSIVIKLIFHGLGIPTHGPRIKKWAELLLKTLSMKQQDLSHTIQSTTKKTSSIDNQGLSWAWCQLIKKLIMKLYSVHCHSDYQASVSQTLLIRL